MATTLNPLQATDDIRAAYLRYLKTIYPFQDSGLRELFWQEIEQPERLVKGPLLEAAPPFRSGLTIEQLTESGILSKSFGRLCSEALPLTRALHIHQEKAVHKAVAGRNVIVATGTGSGKTESFLIPVLNHLLREEESGTLTEPGVRALLLYPMNALVNDQLKRLRRVLSGYPAITFGRYTGETKEDDSDAREQFARQFSRETLHDNELISRSRIRQTPPHILITNYAMLEYLLLRPEDCELFDGDAGKHWRFIVLDEAHSYDGAIGTELALLLRRLKDRVVRSEPGRIQCIATSATLGKGRSDFPATVQFASALFGEYFEWIDSDPNRQDVVEAERVPVNELGIPWGEGTVDFYKGINDALSQVNYSVTAEAMVDHLTPVVSKVIPATVLTKAQQALRMHWKKSTQADEASGDAVGAFLYEVLQGDQRLHHLHELLRQKPTLLTKAARKLFEGDNEPDEGIVSLVNLAVRARPTADSLPLLPARYHVFARALEGVFICLNHKAHADDRGRLFLSRHDSCPDCKSRVFEIATCTRCGATYLVGQAANMPDPQLFRQLSGNFLESPNDIAYFLLGENFGDVDEDEAVTNEDDDADELGSPHTLCLICGIVAATGEKTCDCEDSVQISLQRVDLKGHTEPHRCVCCSAHSNNTVVYRFLTGQDAPASVLATALYQQLPPDTKADNLPGQGRKLLIFSDSRQDAAFFAPYLERTYSQVLRRRVILKTLLDHPEGRDGNLRLQDAVDEVLKQANAAGVFEDRQSKFERRKQISTWLMQEFLTTDRRLGLEGTGLLQFRLVKPESWQPPAFLTQSPWDLTHDEVWSLMSLLLDTVRIQAATTYLENVDVTDEAFAPRNRELYIRERNQGSGAKDKAPFIGWIPARGANRRLHLMMQLLMQRAQALPPDESRSMSMDALQQIWIHLTTPGSVWRRHLINQPVGRHGIGYRLNCEFWELVPSQIPNGYQCSTCLATSKVNLLNICTTSGCNGKLEAMTTSSADVQNNHYRSLYLGMSPIPLSVEEHTAQWTNLEASNVQERFTLGELNALSCSTTFEMGVDVGDLQAVLMRNMPPTTANYLQRAGRAGRRTDAAAFALTFAQRRSHDLTHYADPERIVAGKIQPPRITLTNEKIIRRHAQATFFGEFFRYALQQHGRTFGDKVGTFFSKTSDTPSGDELAVAFANSHPELVREALMRIVPVAVQEALGISTWKWLTTNEADGMLDTLDRVASEVRSDLELYRQLEEEAWAARDGYKGEHYKRVQKTLTGRSLIGTFASRNLLPKYGFPTDVVAMKTDHLQDDAASRVQLERDLRIAISEYAPSAEIVAAKRIWKGGGLYKQPNKAWPVYHYAVCKDCGQFFRDVESAPTHCHVCGTQLTQRGEFIIPEFGFIAARDVHEARESRPQRLYSSRVYFAKYDPPTQSNAQPNDEIELVQELSTKTLQIKKRYSHYGKLALVNSGVIHRGFRVCEVCGYADFVREREPSVGRKKRNVVAAHRQPLNGKDCNGILHTRHLGHEFLTDVLELQFSGSLAYMQDGNLWRSLVYALLEGAASELGIRRDDLDGTLYRHVRDEPPAIVLFDNVPGGAGHVQLIGEHLKEVFAASLRKVNNECCGAETSCYECLRNYRNQPYHEELQRGLARDFLKTL